MKFTLFLFVAFAIVAVECDHLNQKEAYEQLMKLLSTPIQLERYSYETYAFSKGYNSHKVKSFIWKSCDTAAPVQAKVALTPDPIVIPGNITVAFKASVRVVIESKVTLKLTVKKKVLLWIPVPCISNVGSCTYDDICTFFKNGTQFPDPLQDYNIPSHCPIAKGDYNLPATNFKIPDISLPDFLTSGDYQVTAKASHNGHQLACYFMKISLA